MIVQFTPPEQSDSFYSKPMHDEFCKLCDQIGIPENKRTEYAEKMGFGFGYVYMCEMQKAIHSGNVSYFLKEADGHLYRYDDALNNAAANVESTVGGAMTHYLVDRGGTVDCWPSPFWPDAFSLNLISKQHERYYNEEDEEWVVKDEKKVSGSFSVPFTYFGSKYVQRVRTEVSTDGSDKYTDATQKTETWRIDQNPGLVYRHHSYVPEKPDE